MAKPSANAIVDATKAAGHLSDFLQSTGVKSFELNGDVVLFGHSEGSFAVLASLSSFDGSLDGEWHLRGVAVSAPPAHIAGLLSLQRTMAGQILTAYAVSSYSRHHPELDVSKIVSPKFLQVMDQVAELCSVLPQEGSRQSEIFEHAGLGVLTLDGETDGSHLASVSIPPAWQRVFDQNVPEALLTAPSKLPLIANQQRILLACFPDGLSSGRRLRSG